MDGSIQLSRDQKRKTLIIGIGNPDRGDDVVGLLIARKLKSLIPPAIDIIEHTGGCADLLDLWNGYDQVFLIDAVVSGAPPATLHRFNAKRDPVPREWFSCSSTHSFGVADAIALAKTLRSCPSHLTIYGIEGIQFNIGGLLSPVLRQEIERIANIISKEILQT